MLHSHALGLTDARTLLSSTPTVDLTHVTHAVRAHASLMPIQMARTTPLRHNVMCPTKAERDIETLANMAPHSTYATLHNSTQHIIPTSNTYDARTERTRQRTIHTGLTPDVTEGSTPPQGTATSQTLQRLPAFPSLGRRSPHATAHNCS
jgi:hypothetical protein